MKEQLEREEKEITSRLSDIRRELIRIAHEEFFEKYKVKIGDEVQYELEGIKKGVLVLLTNKTNPMPVVQLFKADRTLGKRLSTLWNTQLHSFKKIEI